MFVLSSTRLRFLHWCAPQPSRTTSRSSNSPREFLSVLAFALGLGGLPLASLGIYRSDGLCGDPADREIGMRMTMGA